MKLHSADHADSIAAISLYVSTLSDASDCSGANDSTGANVEAAKQAELKSARSQVAYQRQAQAGRRGDSLYLKTWLADGSIQKDPSL